MVNEQLTKLIDQLEKNNNLSTDRTELEQFLNNCQTDSAPISLIFNHLLATIQQQANELETNRNLLFTYQAQTHGLHSKLTRNKPRRLSLDEQPSYVDGIISPRQGFGRSSYDSSFSPFLSPHTPLSARSTSPAITELDTISTLVEQRENELTEGAEEVIAELKTNEEKLHRQLVSLTNELNQKDDYINSLETKQEEQEEQLTIWQSAESNSVSLQTTLTKQQQEISKLTQELAETDNDFLLATEKNTELNKQLLVARQKQAELESKLEYEINERERLENNKEQTFNALLAKYQEIARAKEEGEKQRAELANLIQQQEDDYEQEKQQREEQFHKQLDNLRTFQIDSSSKTKTTRLKSQRHHHSFSDVDSLPSSRSVSPFLVDIQANQIVFSSRPKSRPKSGNLSSELQRKGYQEKFGIITDTFASSPLNNQEENVFETSFSQSNHKRQSSSSLISSPLQDILTQDDLIIDNILKRMFIRCACFLAEKVAITALATGDALAQVASQTIESLDVISQVSSLIIFRPLISWDKEEIIKEAKRIGTYELSLNKYEDCCSLFEPQHPVTKPRKEPTKKLEKEILWAEVLEMIGKKITNSLEERIIKLKYNKNG